MKYILWILLLAALVTSFWSVYNQGWLDSVKLAGNLVNKPMDYEAFNNIKSKCGVLDTDLVYTTSLRKISDCLDRLSDIKQTKIKIGESLFTIPRDGKRIYSFIIPVDVAEPDQCHAWCKN